MAEKREQGGKGQPSASKTQAPQNPPKPVPVGPIFNPIKPDWAHRMERDGTGNEPDSATSKQED